MLTGTAQWEKGADLLSRIKVPPAPPLSPEEALRSFRVAPGYRVELVAAEPMVQNPIFFEFDPAGRIWVVEYQGYMRDIKGGGEGDPICRVVVLEDTDGDGRADKSTVFLDRLVMPRSLTFVKGGVLVQEPPKVWFCEDTDGDLRCDRRTEVGTMGVAGNPQHTANGLRYGIDNWLHSADSTKRHRWLEGKFIEEETVRHGQFGVTFDETGRFMTCHQNSALHADLIPAEYLVRNHNLARVVARGGRGSGGVSVNIATEAQEVFPIRVTPGITLGALELRDDARLQTYTIASGTCYYDGEQLGEEARGNVFVPEAGGNLIGRLRLSGGIRPNATRFYPAEQEFLASSDERFRPVNARVGPDGALYVADMYHGIIEHVIFMVPWISDQVRDRKLDTGRDMGRLYRVVRDDRPVERGRPRLDQAGSSELITHLGDATGWWRLTAQRLLVERRDPSAVPPLREQARRGSAPLGRLHALWALDGLGALDPATKFAAMGDGDDRVRAAAIRLSERGLAATEQSTLLAKLGAARRDRSESVRLQATLTASAMVLPESLPLLLALAIAGEDTLFDVAALSGREGRELEFLQALLRTFADQSTFGARQRRIASLAVHCVLEAGDAPRNDALIALLETAGRSAPWHHEALLEALTTFAPTGSRRVKPAPLTREPAVLLRLARGSDASLRQVAYRALEVFAWPGAVAETSADTGARVLSALERKRVEEGREIYTAICSACHQGHGGGAPNVAPSLAASEWVKGPVERVARIVMHGLYGPISVGGQTWNLSMPALGASGILDDDKMAAVISYVRRAWGNDAGVVEPQLIAGIRRETGGRTLPWTAGELTAVPGQKEGTGAGPAVVLRPIPSGEILLPAGKAVVYAQKLGYRQVFDVLAPWTVATDIAEWTVELESGGTFEVRVNLAADDDSAGDFFVVETEGSRTRGEVPSTGDYETFREQPSGRLVLRSGVNRIQLKPDGPLKRELADVRGIRLIPASAR